MVGRGRASNLIGLATDESGGAARLDRNDLAIIGALFAVFIVVGTWFFVRAERNR